MVGLVFVVDMYVRVSVCERVLLLFKLQLHSKDTNRGNVVFGTLNAYIFRSKEIENAIHKAREINLC